MGFQVSVENADEPPVFIAPAYTFEVEENAPEGTMVGRVHAKDTDSANNPVRCANTHNQRESVEKKRGSSSFFIQRLITVFRCCC